MINSTFRKGTLLPALLVMLLPLSACREEAAGTSSIPTENVKSTSSITPLEDAKINILFIGNSLTSTNDLPGVLRAMIVAADAGPARIDSYCYPNFGLEDHWQHGRALKTLAKGGWDVVVLQQGPSATEGRPSLLEYSKKFAKEIEANGAKMALYMVWPAKARDFDFEGVCESYRMAAEQTGSLLFPAGEAWRIAWESDASIKLYGRDGFHPSPAGTYLAALVMFQQLTDKSPVGLPSTIKTRRGRTVKLSDDLATRLQQAAEEANERYALH